MPPSRILVVGAGAVGLQTALELTGRKEIKKVFVQALNHPLDATCIHNCSVGAGGFWKPSFSEDPRVDLWALETLDELLSLKDSSAGLVEIVPAIILQTTIVDPPAWSRDERLKFEQLSLDQLETKAQSLRLRIPPIHELAEAGYNFCWFFWSPVVDPPKMLQWLLEQLEKQGVTVKIDHKYEYRSVDDLLEAAAALECDAVVNCTGLGARNMLGDTELVGGRGILHLYDRESCVRRTGVDRDGRDCVIRTAEPPYASHTHEPCYIIPRGNALVVGGSYSQKSTDATITKDEHTRLLRNACLLGIDTTQSQPIDTWVGFRPTRTKIRCEVEKGRGTVLIGHCYGHGGSGWTINVGTAKACVDELLCK